MFRQMRSEGRKNDIRIFLNGRSMSKRVKEAQRGISEEKAGSRKIGMALGGKTSASKERRTFGGLGLAACAAVWKEFPIVVQGQKKTYRRSKAQASVV